jgi:NADP-dependent 3-hydroxy acid dehydrogenase YdfG
MRTTRLQGKVAVVTGASRGIGAAVARLLDEQGVRLGLASRSGAMSGSATPSQARATSGTRPGGRARQRNCRAFGRLDIVVANAGVGAYGSFLELRPDHVEEMIDVNVKGPLYTVRAALPHLLASGEGDIVTLASEAGRRGFPYETVYCASKFASHAPSTTSCASTASAAPTSAPAASPPTSLWDAAELRKLLELRGMMSAEDVAEAVLFVLTRPRNQRILETVFRPMIEPSRG